MPDVINLASVSRGNATLVTSEHGGVLVDAGISALELNKRLNAVGASPKAVLVTHEHVDHVRGLSVFCKDARIPVYAHAKIAHLLVDKYGVSPDLVTEFGDVEFSVGDFAVTPFRIPHDTIYPVGFVLRDDSGTCGVATDLGQVTRGVAINLSD